MATVSALSTKSRRFFRTRELDKFVTLLNGLDTDSDLTIAVSVDSTDGTMTLEDLTDDYSDLRTLVDGMANSSTLDVTITKDSGGAVTAEESA